LDGVLGFAGDGCAAVAGAVDRDWARTVPLPIRSATIHIARVFGIASTLRKRYDRQ